VPVSLANNHAPSFESEALRDTVELLHEAGIETVGPARNRRRLAAVRSWIAGVAGSGFSASLTTPASTSRAGE
jgi:Bacterial capsule synthesis protein PGA_cap